MSKALLNIALGFLGGLSAAMLCFFISRPPCIATVDIQALVKPFIEHVSEARLTPSEQKRAMTYFERTLHETLQAYIKKHHVILLSKPCMIAGVHVADVTHPILKTVYSQLSLFEVSLDAKK